MHTAPATPTGTMTAGAAKLLGDCADHAADAVVMAMRRLPRLRP